MLIGLGTIVLALPISAANGHPTPLLDAAFTATSAVCVTGLVVVDTGTHWSGFGQVVILLLIQAGGFGIMTGSTLLLLIVVRGRTRLRDRVLVQESIGGGDLGNVPDLVKRLALFTFAAEAIGAILLAPSYHGNAVPGGPDPLWFGIFHSVSAFNNAGFDLMGAAGQYSLVGFQSNYAVLGVIGALIVLGGLGYAIVDDLLRKRSWRRLALETKVVTLTTVALLVGGAIAIGLLEWNNEATLGSLGTDARVVNAAFQSVTLRTAGYTALDTGAFLHASLFVAMALMFIGGASGSTAGGIKTSTFSTLLIAITSTVRGLPSAEAFGRRIEHIAIYRALAVVLLSIAFVFVTAVLLEVFSGAGFVQVLFETISAFATVGLTTGITAELPDAGHLLLIVAMYVGRLGPLVLILALTARRRSVSYRHAVETIRIG